MKPKKINSQFVFAKKNTVFINSSRKEKIWYPINFQWIPVIKLKQEMQQQQQQQNL